MNAAFPWGVGLAVYLLLAPAQAAQITTEQFSAGANGWTGTVSLSLGFPAGEWAFNSGAARLTLYDNGGFPSFASGALRLTAAASSGAFTGNYDTAGIEVIGFRILAENWTGTNVLVRWGGSTSEYQRLVAITQTGVWQTVAFSLARADLVNWTVFNGSISDFEAARADVKSFKIEITQDSGFEENYQIDDVFVDRLPAALALGAGSNGLQVNWQHLRTGFSYRVESATSLTPPNWTSVTSLVATASVFQATHETAQPAQSYRMVLE